MLIRLVLFLIDFVLLVGTLVAVLIAVTGGTEFHVSDIRVRAHSVGNLTTFLLIVAFGRYYARRHSPFLALRSLPLKTAAFQAARSLQQLYSRLEHIPPGRAYRLVLGLAAASFAVKATNGILHPGFLTGDDVEINEMTLGAIFGRSWPVWNLRSAFFPMTFIYPIQCLLVSVGVTDTSTLIAAGRLVVATLSTLLLPLIYVACRRLYGTGLAVIAVCIATASGLSIDLGSTELPRPVSAVLVFLAFHSLSAPAARSTVLAGAALGLAATLRFSEVIFMIPALLQLLAAKSFRLVFVMVAVWCSVVVSIQGLSDWLYWGQPFRSAIEIVDFTLVKGLSSRGYESVFHYAVTAPAWTNPLVIGLAVCGMAGRHWRVACWAWVPILLLSLLPHKEARYLVPSLSFVFVLAALGLRSCLHFLRAGVDNPLPASLAVALALGIPAAGLTELARFHVNRTDAEVRLAREISRGGRSRVLVVEQLWRMGGRLYLHGIDEIIEADSGLLSTQASLLAFVERRAVDGIALRRNTCERTRCDVLLGSVGFTEPQFEWSPKADYRYFQRRQSRDGRGAAGAPDDPSQKRHQGRDFAGRVGR